MTEQYCLRWNNHQSTVISVFENLLESGSLIDCTLCADGKLLKAHKVVLSACSSVFESMLCQQGGDKHPIIFLKDVRFEEMKAMLDYMYKGEANVHQELLDSFLKTAASLQIKGLTDQGGGGGTDEPPPKKGPGVNANRKAPPPLDATPESSREGSISPTMSRKRRRPTNNMAGVRRPSSEDASADNSCDTIPMSSAQNVSNQQYQAAPPVASQPPSLPMPQPSQSMETARVTIKKQEPLDQTPQSMIQPKTEFIDESNEDVEDLTLDDDDDYNDSMSEMSKPGTSYSMQQPSQDFQWSQMMGGNDSRSGADESFMQQDSVNNQGNTQGIRLDRFDSARSPKDSSGNRRLRKCGLCSFSSYCEGTMLTHESQHYIHGGDAKKAIVKKEMTTKPKMSLPDKVDGLFKCVPCNKQYQLLKSLVTHRKHECGREPSFLCGFCSYKSYYAAHLRRHNRKCRRKKALMRERSQRQSQADDEIKKEDRMDDKKNSSKERIGKSPERTSSSHSKSIKTASSSGTNAQAVNQSKEPKASTPGQTMPTSNNIGSSSVEKKFIEKTELRKKFKEALANKHPCDMCSIAFSNLKKLNKHKLLEHKRKLEKLPDEIIVDDSDSEPDSVAKNDVKFNSNATVVGKNRPYSCDTCGQRFSLALPLKIHQEACMKGDFTCCFCSFATVTKGNLVSHLKVRHGRIMGSTPYLRCLRCNRACARHSLHHHDCGTPRKGVLPLDAALRQVAISETEKRLLSGDVGPRNVGTIEERFTVQEISPGVVVRT